MKQTKYYKETLLSSRTGALQLFNVSPKTSKHEIMNPSIFKSKCFGLCIPGVRNMTPYGDTISL